MSCCHISVKSDKRFLLVILFSFVIMMLPCRAMSVTVAECDSLIIEAIKIRESHENLDVALKILQDVQSVAKANRWYKQEFLALNNIGAVYLFSHSYGEALDFFNQAYIIAAEHLKSRETKTALNNIAILYTKEGNLPKAVEIFEKAYNIAINDSDSLQIGLYSLNLSQAYLKMGQYEKAQKYLDISKDYVEGNDYLIKQRLGLMADFAYLRGNYREARRLCSEIFAHPDIHNGRYLEVLHEAYFIMARASLKLGDRDSAARYGRMTIGGRAGMEQKIEGFQFLADLEYSLGDYNKAFAYKDSVICFRDSLYSLQNNRLLKISKAKFEVQEYQHELTMKESQLYSLKLVMIVSAIALIILAALAWWGIKNNIQKLRQRQESEENKRILAERLLREKETEAELEHERLKGQIEIRNRQLAAKALYLSGRDKVVEEMITLFGDKDSLSLAQRCKLDELRNGFDSEREWNEFAKLFEQTNNGLLLKLKQKHVDLNAADLRFIIYVYMNLSSKEIASMFSITLDACRKRKERVSKKLGLESANDLHNYLFSL